MLSVQILRMVQDRTRFRIQGTLASKEANAEIKSDVQEKEASSAAIHLEDDDPTLIRAMLDHCYSRDYPAVQSKYRGYHGLLFDARLLNLADKYMCPSLAKDIGLAIVREVCSKDLKELEDLQLYAALDVVYDLPSSSLVEDVRKLFMRKCVHALRFTDISFKFQNLLDKHPELGRDYLQSFREASHLEWKNPSSCISCRRVLLVISTGGGTAISNLKHGALSTSYTHCPFCGSQGRPSTVSGVGQFIVGHVSSESEK